MKRKALRILFILLILLGAQLFYNINTNVLENGVVFAQSVNQIDINNEKIYVDLINNQIYTGRKIEPKITIIDKTESEEKVLEQGEDKDYIVSYDNNINAGTATVTITGKGNYTGTRTVYFNIIKNVSYLKINVTSNYTYTGSAIKAAVKVYDGNKLLNLNKDYSLLYKNNTNKGTATVTITGMGNYKGSINKTFKIVTKSIKKLKINVTQKYTYSGKKRNATVKIYNGSKKLKVNKDYKLTYKNNVKTGKATVTIKGIGNFKDSVNKTYYILPKKASIKSVIMNRKNTQATITWKKDTQASGYAIYRATSKNGKYTKIKTIKKKSTTKYVAKNLSKKKTYYFKVRSYKTISGKRVYSQYYSNSKTNTGLIAKISLYSSSSTKNRNTNLKVASKAINGIILKPGQTFNWFKVVGKTSAKKGYKNATVFENHKAVQGMGGGICQVSTTLYQAAKKAGLKIVERHTHSLPVSYTRKGKDATVAYGAKNLRIKNNKKYAIKIVTSSSGGRTTCKIYRVNY